MYAITGTDCGFVWKEKSSSNEQRKEEWSKQTDRDWGCFFFFSFPLRDTLKSVWPFPAEILSGNDVCKHEHEEEPVCVFARNSLYKWPRNLKPKFAQNRLYSIATTNISVSNKEFLSLALSFTVKSNQQDSTEQEKSKPHGILGTKAGIIQGIIQEQLTFLNRTIPSTGVKYSNISYYTWHNKWIIFLFVSFLYVSSHGEKWLMWHNKRSNKERTGNSNWNGVFLCGDFKWQCNRCPSKGWRGLINLDCSDKSGLCLASHFFLFGNNSLGGWFDIIRISMALIVVHLLWEFL